MLPTTEALLPTAPPAQAGDKPLTRYAARFHMLAIYSTLSLLNAFLWIGFAPIEPLARSYFGVGTWAINLLSAIFMVLYAPGSLLGAYLMQRHGLRLSLVVGAALQCFGGWLRYLGTVLLHDWGFTVLLLGQGLAGLAQPVFTNAPAKLAGEWFPSSERELATVVGALSNVVGNAVGQVVPSVMVTCDASPSADNTTRACSEPAQITGMASLALLQAGLGTAALLWAALCLRAEPPTPPTRSAQERRAARAQLSCAASTPRLRRRASLREVRANTALLLRDAQFLLILAGFGVGLGLFNGLLTDLGQLIQPLYCRYTATASTAAANTAAAATAATDAAAAAAATGAGAPPPYTCDIAASSRDAGLYGGVMIGAGLLGAAAVGAALDATHRYKTFLKGGFVAAVGGIGFCMAQLRPANSAVLAAAFGVMGLCTMPLLPVALECAVECTYPVPEELSASLLMLVGNLVGLGTTYGLQALIGLAPVYEPQAALSPAAWSTLGTVGVAALLVLSFNGEYKRLHADRAAEQPPADAAERPRAGEEQPGSSARDALATPRRPGAETRTPASHVWRSVD